MTDRSKTPRASRDLRARPSEPVLASADEPMTAEQATLLKRLAEEAFELEAFKPALTKAKAAQRIAFLQAKLKLMGGPPHTL